MFVLLTALSLLLGVVIWMTPTPNPAANPVRPAPVLLGKEPQIRVRIFRRVSQATISASSPLTIVDHLGQTTQWPSPITISRQAGGFTITTSDSVVLKTSTDQPFKVHAKTFKIDSITLQAELSILPAINEQSLLDVVATMPIERYLPGVLVGELLSGWPPGVFRAQAVAARSYALHERELALAKGWGWDLERSTRSQSFGGQTSLRVALDAVADTRGQVLEFDEKLLRAYYSSSVGGRAASAADVFRHDAGYEFNLAPPLQATDREYFDQGSPAYRWERRRDVNRLTQRIRAWANTRNKHPAQQLAQLTKITASAHNRVGRPKAYTLTDINNRSATLTAEQLRVACNFANKDLPAIPFEQRVLSSDFEIKIKGSVATLNGRGFGHGVGMCQYSAAYLAGKGEHYSQILERYYPGAQLVGLYD